MLFFSKLYAKIFNGLHYIYLSEALIPAAQTAAK